MKYKYTMARENNESYEAGYATGFCEGWSDAYEFGYIEGVKSRRKRIRHESKTRRRYLMRQRIIGVLSIVFCGVLPFFVDYDIAISFSIVLVPLAIGLIFSRHKLLF